MSVGKDPEVCNAVSSSTCSSSITLSADYVGVSAHATSTLMPTWKTSLPSGFSSFVAPAKDGGLWLLGSAADGLVVQHLSAAGELGPRNVLPSPAGSLGSAAPVVSIEAVTPDARGPLVLVTWFQFGDRDCSVLTSVRAADSAVCFRKSELVVLNVDDVGRSQRVERADGACQAPGAVYRSLDGASVTVLGRVELCQMQLTGELNWSRRLPADLSIVASAPLDADRVIFASFRQHAADGTSAPPNTLALSVLPPDGDYDERVIDRANALFYPRTVILPGLVPGQYSVVLDRWTPGGATGDLSVARFEGRELKTEQVLVREDYTDLSVVSASTDAAATVYIATGIGIRDLSDTTDYRSIRYTPVLCRVPLGGPLACYETPLVWGGQPWTGVDGRTLQATSPHVVYSVFGGSITDLGDTYEVSRYDLP